jgi:hypothetical protein
MGVPVWRDRAFGGMKLHFIAIEIGVGIYILIVEASLKNRLTLSTIEGGKRTCLAARKLKQMW